MSKTPNPVPPEWLDLYDKLVRTIPGIERQGAGVPYTSLNGNMFSYLHASSGLALRLPPGEREKFLEKYQTRLFDAYGVVQKEYVTVPSQLLKKTSELKPYFKMSCEYAQTLKPKPAKKKR